MCILYRYTNNFLWQSIFNILARIDFWNQIWINFVFLFCWRKMNYFNICCIIVLIDQVIFVNLPANPNHGPTHIQLCLLLGIALARTNGEALSDFLWLEQTLHTLLEIVRFTLI